MDPRARDGAAGTLDWARRRIARGRFASAERALRRGPAAADPEALVLRAEALRALGRHAEARVLLRRAVRIAPGVPSTWRALAECCWTLRRLGEAERALREAVGRGREPRSLALLGAFLARERGLEAAGHARLVRAARRAPRDPFVQTLLGRERWRRGEVEAARAGLLGPARRNHAPAQVALAETYAGDPRARVRARAGRWLARAAAAGCPEACFRLARRIDAGEDEGRGARRIALHARAAARGHAAAQRELGRCYARADGVRRDVPRAARWYRRAAALGDVEASFALGELYDGGVGVEADPQRARDAYRNAARRGHAGAQLALGVLLHSGALGPEAAADAPRWLQRAARRGSAGAAFYLGVLHASAGDGAAGDALAARWLRRAARQGHAPACHELGLLLLQGRAGFDDPQAAGWLGYAAAAGLAEAQHLLGFLHREGRGVERDPYRAWWWLSRAAHQGYAPAQVSAGIVVMRGEGTRFDPARGAAWFARAALQGHAGAQRRLARCHATGVGVPLDLREALKWATLASEAGDAAAEPLRAALTARLSARDRWDARARAFAFAAEARFEG